MGEIGWILSCGVECSETARVHVLKFFSKRSYQSACWYYWVYLHGQITKGLRIPFFKLNLFIFIFIFILF